MTEAMKKAVEWLKDHGGECAVANVKGGGRIFLAMGDHAPFTPITAKRLVESGLAEFVSDGKREKARLRLIDNR